MKFIGYRTLKTCIGASASIIIAQQIGLKYAVSAGIITILSVQSTKIKSITIASQRIFAFLLAVVISSVVFKIFGFNPIVFGMFLLIFIPLAVRFNVEEGIVVSSVLVTHFLVEKTVEIHLICNELALMFVGVGVALLFNSYMPSIEGKIKEDQIYIEEKIKEILLQMAKHLKKQDNSIPESYLFDDLKGRLKIARTRSYKNLNNYFLVDVSYYVQYMEMRMQQFETIQRMREHFQRFFMTYDQTIMISDFTEKVAYSLHEENPADKLLRDLNILREDFKKMALPSTREEFENRAMLFQFLNDMEQFLIIKNEFKKSHGRR
ncbi:aromatic acid exporter family protein [Clostridium sediminicola]|uniref:aromatic acid exporter family protein n=1 Tax=Clostridium sediminicola TaxID=3114879 RepID=UPI0031F2056C